MTQNYIGRKCIAAIIDYSIIFTIMYYLIFIFGNTPDGNADRHELTGLAAMLVTVLPWMIFTLCFEYFLGSTLGNGIVSLKPFNKGNQNKKVTFMQSFKRHLLDPIDMFFFGLVGYLVMKNNNGQRLGDIWANTVVAKYEK